LKKGNILLQIMFKERLEVDEEIEKKREAVYAKMK
jgi:hypothetical protein